MGLKAFATRQYWRPPPGGYLAQVVDIVDLGIIETTYEGKTSYPHKLVMVTELNIKERPSEPRYCISEWFTLTLSTKGNLRPVVEAVLGRAISDKEEEKGFDLDNLIGTKLMIGVVDKKSGHGAGVKIRSVIHDRKPNKRGFRSSYIRPEYLQSKADNADLSATYSEDDTDKNLGF